MLLLRQSTRDFQRGQRHLVRWVKGEEAARGPGLQGLLGLNVQALDRTLAAALEESSDLLDLAEQVATALEELTGVPPGRGNARQEEQQAHGPQQSKQQPIDDSWMLPESNTSCFVDEPPGRDSDHSVKMLPHSHDEIETLNRQHHNKRREGQKARRIAVRNIHRREPEEGDTSSDSGIISLNEPYPLFDQPRGRSPSSPVPGHEISRDQEASSMVPRLCASAIFNPPYVA